MDSDETLPALQDERSVMSFLFRPAAVLIGLFFLSNEEFGEDGSSPGLHISRSLVCHVDLDSLWMAPWDDCGTLETGSRPGISIWRNVMCSVARLSRMSMCPVTGCLRSFGDLGRAWVLDLNAGATYTPVWMPGGNLETVPPKPLFPPCCVVVLPSATVAQVRGGSRRRGCAGTLVAWKVDSSLGEKCAAELGFPRASHSPGEKCAAELGFPRASHTPGKRCAEEPGYIRPVLVAGPPVFAWVVTGSLLKPTTSKWPFPT